MKKSVFTALLLCAAVLLTSVPVSAAESPISGKTVICFGDSLTASGTWENILTSRFGVTFVNAGVGGTTTATSVSRFKTDVLAKKPDIVFICFAYNDAVKINRVSSRVSVEDYRKNLEWYVTELQKIGCDVILFSPNPVIEEYFNANPLHPGEDYVEDGGINALISRYTDVMAEVAKKYDEYYVNLNAAFDGLDLYSLINTDGTHPNANGYAVYAKCLGDFIDSEYNFLRGDANRDGSLTATDYLIVKRAFLGTYTLTKSCRRAGDADGNGVIGAADYLMIKRVILGTYSFTEEK